MKVTTTYLLNSGFSLEIGDTLLIFDYYQDPQEVVKELCKKYDNVYFFASHRHFDHYTPDIFQYDEYVTNYIFSYDIKGLAPYNDKIIYMDEYSSSTVGELEINTYSSTDEGVSFAIKFNDKLIFHAGDFNWWHWEGDTEKNIAFARNGFNKQLKRFHNAKFDLVYFPVDGRLESAMDLGITHFAQQVEIENLVTMHNVNGKIWHIPDLPQFKAMKTISIPKNPGDRYQLKL